MAKKIKFVQGPSDGILPFTKEFASFEEARSWVLLDKEDYGDVLNYGGEFEGLSKEQVQELTNLTLEDAIKDDKGVPDEERG